MPTLGHDSLRRSRILLEGRKGSTDPASAELDLRRQGKSLIHPGEIGYASGKLPCNRLVGQMSHKSESAQSIPREAPLNQIRVSSRRNIETSEGLRVSRRKRTDCPY